jgi:UDP-N-acetylglucosamine 2-epimerase (non-hydrolysing)
MIVIVAGTRPELIKVAPLYLELKNRNAPVALWLTGQHESLADAPLEFFGLEPTRHWKTLEPGQSSNALLAKLLNHIDQAIVETSPTAVIVQGDTTSALAGAIAAFHRQVPVAHVEAGLRTGDLTQPFPEEMNRRVIDSFAHWLFPPTAKSREALIREGHKNVVEPTGNTGIDALFWARKKVRTENYWPRHLTPLKPDAQLVLSTGHRRENLGQPLFEILRALGEEVSRTPRAVLYHVAHPNPEATKNAIAALAGLERVHVIPALDYPDFVTLLDYASVIVTDSGGVQEEAPSFSVPVLITREVTERPEVLHCGGKLIGTNPQLLVEELRKVWSHQSKYEKVFQATPFGDGNASGRIIKRMFSDLGMNHFY